MTGIGVIMTLTTLLLYVLLAIASYIGIRVTMTIGERAENVTFADFLTKPRDTVISIIETGKIQETPMERKLPNLVERLKSLGNSVVPQQCRKAFEILMGIK